MSKYVKGLLQKQFESTFDGVNEFVVLSTVGIDGNTNNELRGSLLEKGVKMTVVRNSLMRHALKELGQDTAAELFDSGQCTVAYGGESVVDVAKMLVDSAKKIKKIQLKGAFVDGTVVDDKGVVDLSKMPSRAELQAAVVRIAQTPGSNLAGAITGPASYLAGCIKTIIEKAEEAA
ncbi:50S ribosomal protein L10 [Limihaloglobus sulfuriphilus]|uniref:Large ribosomal subunit protein uL10 n=1 Tax=Limihaloglobus sulfuriphilus TaxID=1851148 RepID=A0A1Q2MF59_9BACT|nr:50S ribosomal protein L10 [Limihaloglobus sulfuriphilus]AQQ71336.1 50S ribosomal protein L10 [Limihaloglobus sulfuriphilus]